MVTSDDSRMRLAPVSEGAHRPLWSVMIPTFNCGRFLRQALESVLSQAPGPDAMQIEVVDDCSTQNDLESVVRAVGGGRVCFFRQTNNVGHTRNFETCLQHARGHLVHLLHGDDAVLHGFYLKMGRAFAEYPNLGAAFCRNVMMDEVGNWNEIAPLLRLQSGLLPDLVERLAFRQCIQTPAMVVRREVYETLGSFDRRLTWTEDWEMWARIAAHYPVWYENEPLALYRMHNNSNSGRFMRTGENLHDLNRLFTILEGYVSPPRGKQLCQQGRESYALEAIHRARMMLGGRDFVAARAQLQGAFRLTRSRRVLAAFAGFALWAGCRAAGHLLKGSLLRQRARKEQR